MKKYGKYETQSVAATTKRPKAKSAFLQTYLTSLLCMVLCVSMFFGTSFAWFTSEVESTGNEIYIGILKVDLDKKVGEGWKPLSAAAEGSVKMYTNAVQWEPGYTSVETVRVMNKGDLAFNYELFFTDGKVNGQTGAELLAVAQWFDVWVYHTADNAIPTAKRYAEITAKDSGWKNVGTLADVLNGASVFEGKMDKEDVAGKKDTAHTYTIALHMNGERIEANQKEALNALMGQKLELSVKLVATQRSSEKDSFGDAYYDANAVYTAAELQKALDNATGNTEIILASDITGNVTATQKPGVKITIDGKDHKFDGTITVNGKSTRYETAGLTIKNVNFDAQAISTDAYINLGVSGDTNTRYTDNVTVDGCTFSGNGVVAVKSYTGGDWNLTITGCTVNSGMHSLAQLKNVEKNLIVTGCEVYSKNGLNLNNGNNLAMSGCTFDVEGYAVRFGESANDTAESFTIENSTLKSDCAETGDAVIEFRAGAVNAKLTLVNTIVEGTTKVKGNTTDTTINGLN